MTTHKNKVLAFGLTAAIVVFSLASAYAQSAAPKAKVNINTASASELETLPGVGPKVAQKIIDFRTKNGNFKKVEEIMKLQGIGEKIFENIRDLITVGG